MPTPDDIINALKKLANTRLLIGVPSEAAPREGPISNAAIGYIMEIGSPAQNVPARPHLKPGVEQSRDRWEPYMRQAAQAALEGNDGRMDRALNAAGQTAVSAVKSKITAGIPPPLKPETVAARRRHRGQRGRAARAAYRQFHTRFEAGIETGFGGITPLVDTAQYINSITFVKRQRNS
jgi:hypothetical protein